MRSLDAVDFLKRSYESHGYATVLAVAAVLFFVEFAFIMLVEPFGDVLNFYAQAEMVKDGMLPYRDFVFEFPPFALLFFLIPSLFTSDPNTYAVLFGAMMVLLCLTGLYFIMRLSDRMGINKVLVAAVFIALVMIYLADIVRKYDVIPMVITLMSVCCFAERRTGLAYGLSVFAAFVKIYPIIITVLFLILDLADRRDNRAVRIGRGILACVIVAALAIGPLVLAGVPISDIMSFLSFQGDRGFQVESVMGVIIQGLGLLGLTTYTLVPMYNTQDVLGPIPDAVLPYWNAFVLVVILVILFLIARHAFSKGREGTSSRDLLLYCLVLIAAFIMTNKVFSTQYILWLFPFLAFLPVTTAPKMDRRMLVTVILIDLVSMVIFALYNPGQPEFVIVNLVRDLLIIWVAASIILYLLKGRGYLSDLYRGGGTDSTSRPVSRCQYIG